MSRRYVVALATAVAVGLGIAALALRNRDGTRNETAADASPVAARDSRAGLPRDVAARSASPAGSAAGEPGAAERGLPPADPFGNDPQVARGEGPDDTPWASVDLDAVRAALPDNVYWRLAAPTKDPDVLRERAEERERWNVEYGKVLSNTATEEEVYAFYAHQQRVR